MTFHKERLANGLEIIAEPDSAALSAAVGFFVRTGARDETPELAGVSHFLEHMSFKGSARRSADDVNRLFDEIGAKYNAFTTEEHTVYHAAVLPEYVADAVDLLADLLRPALRQEDFDTEKKVILEEIGMYADSPMWSAFERASRIHFLDHPVGNSVLGSVESVGGLTPPAMRAYHAKHYCAGNLIVVGAGNIDFEQLVQLTSTYCGGWPAAKTDRASKPGHQSGRNEVIERDAFVQESLCMLTPGPSCQSPLRFAAEVLANVIGDDSGSRLYWELVEPGLVDSVDFNYHEYEDVGSFMVNLSCEPEQAGENYATLRRVIAEVAADGITAAELLQAKNKLGARLVLAAERPPNRLFSVAYNWCFRRAYRSVADDLADLESVTLDDVRSLLERYPLDRWTTVCLGPLKAFEPLEVSE